MKRIAIALPVIALLVVIGWLLAQRALAPERRGAAVLGEQAAERIERATDRSGAAAGPAGSGAFGHAAGRGDVVTEEDRRIFARVVGEAREARLDTLPIGELAAAVARGFVGEPYTPQTLELPGDERLVVNLREFDCVTLVENALALARTIRAGGDFEHYLGELRRIRYRGGEIDGYPSRLHYFSEWIHDNERKGLLRDVTRELGGVPDREPITFMSTHREAYPALRRDDAALEAIQLIEARLSAQPRHYIPGDRIEAAEPGIRTGDIIAATSSLTGLDIAHTGIALSRGGRVYLLHAPLIGEEVQIAEEPLAQRIARIDGQDGIMVARPR